MGVNIVGKGQNGCMVTIRILHGNFDLDIIDFAFNVNWFFKNWRLMLIKMLYIALNPTLIVEAIFFFLIQTLIFNGNPQTLVKKG